MGVFLATTTIDTTIVTEIVNLAKTLMGMFTEFPINIFLYSGLAGLGFALFRKAKKSV